jgi:beta-N-acetylhexosaminidase
MDITQFTSRQLAGQRLMVGFEGAEFNEDLMFLVDTIKVGGIILFAENLDHSEQIKNLCLSVQQYARSSGNPSLFIAIDQEGGVVTRLKEPFTQFPGNPQMKDLKDAEHFARTTAAELRDTGINMNMAPVLDLAFENIQSIMAQRSFGHDPKWVSIMGSTLIEHLQKNGMMSVAKHFPGIGRTTLDSHMDMPHLDIDIRELEQADMVPFKAAIKHQVSGIMLSHILYNRIDPIWPASLSTKIAKDLLRKKMAFNGVVMTDDLDMGAIKNHYDIKTVVKQILSAEIDIALICHKGPDIEQAFEEILKYLTTDDKIRAQGIESVKRILMLKEKYLGN